jgi:hypothetical protein
MNERIDTELEETPVEGVDSDAERTDYVRALVAARCPEIDGLDLAQAFGEVAPESDAQRVLMVPAEVAKGIFGALSAINDRISGIEDHILRTEAEGAA